MGLLRAQAVGLVQGTKHGAFQASSREPTAANQDLTVVQVEQNIEDAREDSDLMFDICK